MKVASPKTSLELGASSAGSGVSSSGDDAARTPSKWRAAAESTASSGDEGCSSPDKRARLAIGDGDKAISGTKDGGGSSQVRVRPQLAAGGRQGMPWFLLMDGGGDFANKFPSKGINPNPVCRYRARPVRRRSCCRGEQQP